MRIALFCVFSSLVLIFLFDFNALVAPVMKMLLYAKVFFLKTLPSWFLAAFVAVKKGAAKLIMLVGGWEAWSVKKLFRHVIRFAVTFIARFTFLTFLINLFDGKERKGIRNFPSWFVSSIRKTKLGRIIDWWADATARQKRLLSGVILCIILVAFGQTLLGISILLFDIVWELLILLWRLLGSVFRGLLPILKRIVPNFIGSFVTNRVVPFFTSVVPLIRDDIKVMYLHGSVRERFRKYKINILRLGRHSRPKVRARISPLVPNYVREKKKVILERTVQNRKSDNEAG